MEATLPLRTNFMASLSFMTRTSVPCQRRQTYRVSSALVSRPASGVSVEKVLIVDREDKFYVSSRDSLELIVNNVPGGTDYQDSWFDRLATNHLSQSVQAAVGIRNKKSGYESLVEAARAVYKNFNTIQQRDLVILALAKAFPSPILNAIRTMMPNSRLAREFFAAFTTVFFAWLVGPCEVKESEFNGKTERNVVRIKKCRFLEESNCVGMCLNLCKVPSQTFIKDSLGMPVDMVPNFEDMSCEMVFGKEPLMLKDDTAFKQPCYKLCKAKQKHTTNCIN